MPAKVICENCKNRVTFCEECEGNLYNHALEDGLEIVCLNDAKSLQDRPDYKHFCGETCVNYYLWEKHSVLVCNAEREKVK